MKYLLCILSLLFISNTFAQHVKEFTYLKKYAGEYSADKVLNDKRIRPILIKMMGKDYEHLNTNLMVTGPVDLISGSIVIEGNAPHQGGEEMAILDINLYTGIIRTAIYSHNKIIIFSDQEKYSKFIDKNKYEHLPISILDWIAVVNTKLAYRINKPQNVIIK